MNTEWALGMARKGRRDTVKRFSVAQKISLTSDAVVSAYELQRVLCLLQYYTTGADVGGALGPGH